MKQKIHTLCTLAVIVLLGTLQWHCSANERVVDDSGISWRLLAVTPNNTISEITLPANTERADIFQAANAKPLGDSIAQIATFLDKIYILLPASKRIEVINKDTYVSVATIQTSLAPYSICFSNATTAFVANSKDASVSVIDILNNKEARTIKVGENPTSIASMENMVAVCNQGSNTISIIASNSFQVSTVPAGDAPTFIAANTFQKEFVVVGLGYGKVDSRAATAATISTIDAITKQETSRMPINAVADDAAFVLPKSLAFMPGENGQIAFVPINAEQVNRFDARDKVDLGFIISAQQGYATFDENRTELLLLQGEKVPSSSLTIMDPLKGSVKLSYNLSQSYLSILPLPNKLQ